MDLDDFLTGQKSMSKVGSRLLRNVTEEMRIYPVPVYHFDTILDMDRQLKAERGTGFMCIDVKDDSMLAKVEVDYSSQVGVKGSFKTCHPVKIHPITVDDTNGAVQSLRNAFGSFNTVVAKRYYRPIEINVEGQVKKRILRLNDSEEELKHMLPEANCACIGNALMTQVYRYVDEFYKQNGEDQTLPIARIPRMRFIHSALAIPANASVKAVLLLEEKIFGDFTKFVSNGRAQPLPDLSEADQEAAEFLCFAQHFQYFYTKRHMFVSDFQGSYNGRTGLLTDCQIMTASKHGAGFADGNVEKAFYRFPSDHSCNKFCRYFELSQLDAALAGSESESGEVEAEATRSH
ncbi:hypothetical protein EIP86_001396 [Pleurotus ostreatoroseus]|nr:hypothetical protein EIP86_001396 [Pleurotus ostreatoroseus]